MYIKYIEDNIKIDNKLISNKCGIKIHTVYKYIK